MNLSLGQGNVLLKRDSEEYDRKRIEKGSEQRIKEGRPILFDLFFINSKPGNPLTFPSHCLLDSSIQESFYESTRGEISTEEMTDALAKAYSFNTEYWIALRTVLKYQIEPVPSDLLTPVEKDLSALDVDVDSLRTLQENDLEEFSEFYRQACAYIELRNAKKTMSKLHHDELKRITGMCGSDLIDKYIEFRKRNNIPIDTVAMNYFRKKRAVHHIKVSIPSTLSIEGTQYWGDEEVEFNDLIDIPGATGDPVQYDAIAYMGIDWNDYNRQRYTKANPPPPIVRGYKFSFMFSRAPKWRLDPSLVSNDGGQYKYTALVVDGGSPYAPIAFRIVDRKWDTYRRGGCIESFKDGVFTMQIVFTASLYVKGYTPESLY